MKNKRDADRLIIQKMIGYCNSIARMRNRFGDTFENYTSDEDFQMSSSMCILQIGELTTRLTDEFKAQHSDIPWREIKALRNIHAQEVDFEEMWKILTEDIPELKEKLEQILAE